MLIVGLTGSVASGKNTVAAQFARFHIPVFDADAVVHNLFNVSSSLFDKIKQFFPGAIINGRIDRSKLGAEALNDRKKLLLLESIIHPEVRNAEQHFIRKWRYFGASMVLLNIPLLFEKGGYKRCDKTIAVLVPKLIQKHRFNQREQKLQQQRVDRFDIDLIDQKFRQIINQQVNNLQRQKMADFIIYNGLNKAFTFRQVKKIIKNLTGK